MQRSGIHTFQFEICSYRSFRLVGETVSRHVVMVFVWMFTAGSYEVPGEDGRVIAPSFSNEKKEILVYQDISESLLSWRVEQCGVGGGVAIA